MKILSKTFISANLVITHEGNAEGASCYFPFKAYGQTHYECTRLMKDGVGMYDFYWCSTTPDYSVNKTWGKCPGNKIQCTDKTMLDVNGL